MQNIEYENTFNENINNKMPKIDPFEKVYQFINNEILPKYDCLTTCHLERDWEGNFKEYFVRHNDNITDVTDIIELELKIVGDILEYCIKNDMKKEFDEILVLVTREAPANIADNDKTKRKNDKMQNMQCENIESRDINNRFDGYDLIYQFIKDNILPKYDCLTECYFKRDGEGYFKEYYLRHDGNVSDKWELRFKIKREIRAYCIKNDIEKEYDEISIMITNNPHS